MTRWFVDRKKAEHIGLLNKAVPLDKLEREASEMVKLMAEVPPDSMMIMKEAFNTHAEIMGRGAVVHLQSAAKCPGVCGPDRHYTRP